MLQVMMAKRSLKPFGCFIRQFLESWRSVSKPSNVRVALRKAHGADMETTASGEASKGTRERLVAAQGAC